MERTPAAALNRINVHQNFNAYQCPIIARSYPVFPNSIFFLIYGGISVRICIYKFGEICPSVKQALIVIVVLFKCIKFDRNNVSSCLVFGNTGDFLRFLNLLSRDLVICQ